MQENDLFQPGNSIIFQKPNPRFKAFAFAGVHHYVIDGISETVLQNIVKISLKARGNFDPDDFTDPILLDERLYLDMSPVLFKSDKIIKKKNFFGAFNELKMDGNSLIKNGEKYLIHGYAKVKIHARNESRRSFLCELIEPISPFLKEEYSPEFTSVIEISDQIFLTQKFVKID